jgi:N-acyl-D-aspartate/D-glutamate deacylase
MLDLLIKNGRVVDGSGQAAFYADVAVHAGKIVGVGKYHGAATRTINADGRVVAPGFIDHHTHFDSQAMWDPIVNSTSLNGNTSIIVGQCGAVIAPVRPGDGDWYLRMFNYMEGVPLASQRAGVDFAWETIPQYLDAIERRRGINVGAFVGHSGVRRYVMGEAAQEREATSEEIEAMKQQVREGMLAGALGFSVANFVGQGEGLFGVKVPSSVATDAERYALASVLGELGTGVFQVSGGAPGGFRGPALIAQELARQTGRPAIYNLLAQEINKPDEWKEHLHVVETAFKAGIRAYASCLSATAGPIFDLRAGLDGLEDEDMISPTTVFQGMPTWDAIMAQPVTQRMQSFRDPATRKQLSVEAVETEGAHAYRMGLAQRQMSFSRRWDLVEVYMTWHERNKPFSGQSIAQIAQQQGKGIMDTFLDMALDDELRTSFQVIDRNNDPAAQRQILGSPYTVIGTTDGGARPDKGDRTDYSTRLLSYWVREKQIMSLEEAVYRMTGKTALMHDLHDRGFIAPGKAADITIFDPDTIGPKPREPIYAFPGGEMHVKQGAVGIDYVLVNGEVLLDHGEHTGALPGQTLRGPLYRGARG